MIDDRISKPLVIPGCRIVCWFDASMIRCDRQTAILLSDGDDDDDVGVVVVKEAGVADVVM
jgi:hypothetical protein